MMIEKDKKLLLQDLCSRLPYHPIVKIYNDSWEGCQFGEFDNNLSYHHVEAFVCDRIEIKPYLRPMSDMTEEEESDLRWIAHDETDGYSTNDKPYYTGNKIVYLDYIPDYIDFMCEHHLDYRGLIKEGLAIEATTDMYNN